MAPLTSVVDAIRVNNICISIYVHKRSLSSANFNAIRSEASL